MGWGAQVLKLIKPNAQQGHDVLVFSSQRFGEKAEADCFEAGPFPQRAVNQLLAQWPLRGGCPIEGIRQESV